MSRSRFVLALSVATLLAIPLPIRGENPGGTLADRLSWFNYAMDYAGGVAEAAYVFRHPAVIRGMC